MFFGRKRTLELSYIRLGFAVWIGVRLDRLCYDEVTARNNSPPNVGSDIRMMASINAPSAGGKCALERQPT
jgi:hypothetical protein